MRILKILNYFALCSVCQVPLQAMFRKTICKSITHFTITMVISLSFLAKTALASDGCSTIKTYREVLACVIEKHPEILKATAQTRTGDLLPLQAAQRPNIELSGKTTSNLESSSQSSGEIGLSYAFDVGGKRSARVTKAEAQRRLEQTKFSGTKNEVLLQTLILLQKLTNLNQELQLVKDGTSTFTKIIKSYHSRLKLSPEQDVSLNVFLLAKEEYNINESKLKAEIETLIKQLEFQVDGKVIASSDLNLPTRSSWPNMEHILENQYDSYDRRLQKDFFELSKADLSVAKSEAWPDLQIGPTYEWNHSGSGTENSLGVNFSFPLPFWNRNQGGIAVANAELEKAQLEMHLTDSKIRMEKEVWLIKYKKGVEVLSQAIPQKNIREQNRQLHKKFARGLIPSSLVIEANRQLIETTKARNEQMLSTLEALWNLENLSGNLESEVK